MSPDYAVFVASPHASQAYYLHLFKGPAMGQVFRAESKGFGTGEAGFMRLYTDKFGQIAAPHPPVEEQVAIVRYLDAADRRIHRYVRAKQRLIALLEEQKRLVVHRAVTRGLDPDAPRKPSGVEWLGDVPAHWEVVPLKSVATLTPRVDIRCMPEALDVSFLPMERVGTWGRLDLSERIEVKKAQAGFSLMQDGDVIVAKITPCFENGKGAVCDGLVNGVAFGSTEFHVLRPSSRLNAKYLYHLTRDPIVRRDGAAAMRGSAGQQRVPGQFLSNRSVPLPSVEEQAVIVARLEVDLLHIDQTVSRSRREIELIGEYRTRLVADVVTGKLDVRAAVARLPNESDEPDVSPSDSADAIDEDLAEDAADLEPAEA